MEYSKQSYLDVLSMPVKTFYDYMKWKVDIEEDKAKSLQEEMFKKNG